MGLRTMNDRTMTVEGRDGEWLKVPVIPESDLEWVSSDVRQIKGSDRRLRLNGEQYVTGRFYGQVLIESVQVKGGKNETRYAVAKWVQP